MSETTHTPGPWTLGPNTSSSAKVLAPRRYLDPTSRYGTGEEMDALALCFGEGETRKANARLIAEVPALLAACERFVRVLEPGGDAWAEVVDDCSDDVKLAIGDAWEDARAALARARGNA